MSYTKSENSIAISLTHDEPNSAEVLMSLNPASPTSSVSRVANPLSLLKIIFRSLENMEKNKDIQENCSICYSSMTLKRLKILNCKHLIHYKCCKDWIMEGGDKCPVCSVDIKA